MHDQDALYTRLKPDVEAVALPLFELSEGIVRKLGDFLPHGAVLLSTGECELVAASGGMDMTNSIQVLPCLHEALREAVRERDARAIGVAESVTVTFESGTRKAIKVLFEHSEGLVVALYLPYTRKLLGSYRFGPVVTHRVDPEVRPWSSSELGGCTGCD